MSAAPERVLDGEHLRATLHGADGPQLLVTFDNWRKDRAGFGEPVRSNLMQRLGVSQLSVTTARNDWYVNPDTPRLEAALRALRPRFDLVCAIGFSMGAFGAMRLSRAMGARKLTLVSPQASVWPEEAPWSRWRPEGASEPGERSLRIHAARGQRADLLYDPFHPEDRRQAALAEAAMPRISLVPLPFAGHPATALIREAGRFNAVQRAALRPASARGALLREHKAARAGSARYREALERRRAR